MFTETCNMNWYEGEKPDKDTQLYAQYKFNSTKKKHSVRVRRQYSKMLLWIISVWEIKALVDDL